ncbi:Jag N-terminal domain-containing protein [Gemmiger formicilis]|uniref:RNA-binding cell elongation regulator Jag/EloR n=1 Tax=Gemmiger formicilis TaxID=745368 RepID=UPI00210E308B|nr:RNA-binding cell elongation regulator Jag/EloR [Gemmiger formicilis]MCQ5079966.1 Jag N-terminal domain-containing protein [Gemmiger formicilis]MCQ5117229.1 Jag N-terminal domain-containing protein [Gemmiger formicilis]
MRSMEMSAKTVEAAVQAACDALGVDRDDINVSYEVLEFPARKLFKTIPAKVLVKVEEPEAAPAPVAEEKPAEVSTKPAEVVEISDETAPAIEKAVVEEMVEDAELAPVAEDEVEIPLDIATDPRLQAAVDYLTPIFNLMGVENFTFSAVKKGAATILKVSGEHMGALIGRRGETMESLSYLASLVVNRMEGPYVKLGLDVGGYRNKREDDLSALAKRIADRVIRTGCYYEMEPMNPYERHIIHTAIAEIDGVRSESKGEGPARHVVLYSTDPDACNLPDRDNARNQRGGRREGGRGQRRDGGHGYRGNGSRGPRSGRDGVRGGYRGQRSDRGPRYGGPRYGGPRSSVPAREFADTPRDPDAKPMAPKTTERIHDGDDFAFGKIEF